MHRPVLKLEKARASAREYLGFLPCVTPGLMG
jgi:hypothetical protein